MNTISNYCRFIGRLTDDPKVVEFEHTTLCTFTLAINEYRKEKNGEKKKTVNYFDFEAWDTGATTIAKYTRKGDEIFVHASARPNNWTDKAGRKNYQVKFRVKEFKLFNYHSDEKEAVSVEEEANQEEFNTV